MMTYARTALLICSFRIENAIGPTLDLVTCPLQVTALHLVTTLRCFSINRLNTNVSIHICEERHSVCHSVIPWTKFDFSAYCGRIGLKLGWVVGAHHSYLDTRWRPYWPPGGAPGGPKVLNG